MHETVSQPAHQSVGDARTGALGQKPHAREWPCSILVASPLTVGWRRALIDCLRGRSAATAQRVQRRSDKGLSAPVDADVALTRPPSEGARRRHQPPPHPLVVDSGRTRPGRAAAKWPRTRSLRGSAAHCRKLVGVHRQRWLPPPIPAGARGRRRCGGPGGPPPLPQRSRRGPLHRPLRVIIGWHPGACCRAPCCRAARHPFGGSPDMGGCAGQW